MKLLFIAPYVPSPIRVRTYQLLRHLAKRGCQITLVCLEDVPVSAAARTELQQWCQAVYFVPLSKPAAALRCLVALPTPKPLWVAYCQTPELVGCVEKLVATQVFDAAHVEHLRAASIRPALGNLPCVLDAVDCITSLQRQMFEQGSGALKRLLAWEEWVKLQHWEPRAYLPYDSLAVTSSFDANALRALGAGAHPTVIPNGVDLEYFHPDPTCPPEPDTLVFSGKMSYRANEDAALWFANTHWPHLKAARPALKWLIVGSDPSPAVRQLAQRPGIEVTGFVDDLRPYLRRASVAICPLRIGVGIQNKALEAMALGLPVVASPVAGRALLDAKGDGGITIAETEADFIETCKTFLSTPAQARAAGVAARQFVEKNHRWECTAQRFMGLYSASKSDDRN